MSFPSGISPNISTVLSISAPQVTLVKAPSTTVLRTQYHATTPIVSTVEVAPGVTIHVEEHGNPNGTPVAFFHGGPGIKFRDTDHQWFNPERYRIIMFQQRGTSGCTPSALDFDTPSAIFQDVTIATLGQDIETLRKHFNIDKWLIFGGSWGSTLGVFYAQEYPEQCIGVIVRGIFLATKKENALFFDRARHAKQCGEHWRPEALERVVNYATSKGYDASLDDPATIYAAYSDLCVKHDDRIAQRIWTAFEEWVDAPTDMEQYERLMKDECETTSQDRSTGIWESLLMNSVSMTYDLLSPERLAKMKGIPVQIVQGALDKLCHPSIAQELVDGLKDVGCQVKYNLVPDGEHSPYSSPGMINVLVGATDSFVETGNF